MNPLPPNADELVSAYLDNEATPEEVAIVESTPELLAQVDSLRALTGPLGAAVAPPTAQKEAHLAAALGAFDALFADTDSSNNPVASDLASPTLAVVPDPTTKSTAAVDEEPESTVRSLESARERRRPRRFNIGVIAAAVAALLLFAGLTALSLGGNQSSDIASSAEDTVETSSDDSASDASSDDEPALSPGGLSEAQRASPAPLEAASGSAPAAEVAGGDTADAMEDFAMDEEEAMEEEAEEEESAGAVDADAEESTDTPFFIGEFTDPISLRIELDRITPQRLASRAANQAEGLFPGCQLELPELADLEIPTLVGEAVVANEFVQVHVIDNGEEPFTIYLVDASTCIIATVIEG